MGAKTRVATTAVMKTKKLRQEADSNSTILLARGLSARYCGANTPLSSLTAEEMERDLRHMEAFSNACTAYAQQLYIYENSTALEADKKQQAPPLVAMPVRIDPEEEKRLATLRQKIQRSETQREILECEYLSLRAHYVYLSQRLKNTRASVEERVQFLQEMVQKRGTIIALQRARLQISREVLSCLHYRQSGGKTVDDAMDGAATAVTGKNNSNAVAALSSSAPSTSDVVEVWNQIDEQFKKAEAAARVGGTMDWQALKVPKIPPGVPLLLSQLAKPPGFAAAWGTGGMFGSKPESLCWLEPEFPEPAHRIKSIQALREEVNLLQSELERERDLNRDLQTNMISRKKANVELVSMMALLRTETEAVVGRHNILLESDVAKQAALRLQETNEENNNKAATTTATEVPSAMVDPVGDVTDSGDVNPGDAKFGTAEDGDSSDKRSLDESATTTNSVDGSSPRSKRRKL